MTVTHTRAALAQVTSSAGDRELLQERVALFGLVATVLTGVSLVMMVGSAALQGREPAVTADLFHGAAVLTSFGSWVIGRGAPRSERTLKLVEGATAIILAICFATMAACFPPWVRPDLLAAISVLLIMTARATLVPSSPRRTAVISVMAWSTIFVVSYVCYRGHPLTDDDGIPRYFLPEAFTESAVWSLSGIALVTVTSRVIYGLRREVREAQKLGQYTLLEKLGEGGMGQVFRAQHAMLRRPTAVKLLHPDRGAGAEELARFEREVQLTAQLSHPNVVTVFDYGRTPDGVFYYAMELLEGQNLEEIVAESGRMSPSRTVHVLEQVASGLAEAHAVGLIHRDIKPANIILCARGRTPDIAKVVDFGLVKDLGAFTEEAASAAIPPGAAGASSVSRTGTVMGTPSYLAPETLRDPASVDGRADIYAVGAVGYFLLTGTMVFGEGTIAEVCRHHLQTQPETPSARLASTGARGKVAPDLEAIILKCLAKSPADRYADAGELREALAACSVSRTWNDDDARAWWAKRETSGARTKAAARAAEAPTKTIVVDLAR